MSYEVFQHRVNALIRKAGCRDRVRFINDADKGRYLAILSGGLRISGNLSSNKVTPYERNHTYEPREI